MKKVLLFAVTAILFLSGTALADSVAGKFGITARTGLNYSVDSQFTDYGRALILDEGGVAVAKDIETEIGWTGGGGFLYGINDHLAVTMDIIYFQTKAEASEDGGPGKADFGTVRTVDFSVGAQWRFTPQSRFVPYVGAGVDVLWNHIDLDDDFKYLTEMPPSAKLETDIAFGVHLNAGADFFITPNVALNAEIRGLLSTESDVDLKIYGSTWEVAQYNPSNISGFIGVRFFFP